MSHSEPLWWEQIGKVVNWEKLAISSHSEPLQWEKIGKVANQAKLAIPSHSEALWWCISDNFHCSDCSSNRQKVECNPKMIISFVMT